MPQPEGMMIWAIFRGGGVFFELALNGPQQVPSLESRPTRKQYTRKNLEQTWIIFPLFQNIPDILRLGESHPPTVGALQRRKSSKRRSATWIPACRAEGGSARYHTGRLPGASNLQQLHANYRADTCHTAIQKLSEPFGTILAFKQVASWPRHSNCRRTSRKPGKLQEALLTLCLELLVSPCSSTLGFCRAPCSQ